jgi:hypothetical protein
VGNRKLVYSVVVGKTKLNRPLGRPGLNESLVLKWFFRKWDGGMDCINLAQVRDRWQELEYVVMDIQVV